MKKVLLLVLALSLCVISRSLLRAQIDTVTIIHVNDTHSNLAPIGPRTSGLEGKLGGIARAATVIGTLEATTPNPIFLHAGDLSIGDIFYNAFYGVPEYRILLSLGCKAMAVGNHEFDLGPGALLQSLDTAFYGVGSFPLLSANTILDDPAVAPLKSYIQPYTIVNAGGTKVGIFGLLTPATMLISNPAPALVDTPFKYAAAAVESLTVKGCTVIICLSHLGLSLDEMLASMVPGIHAIVGGHDHFAIEKAIPVLNPLGDTTWIVQANAFYLNVGKLQLVRSGATVRLLDYKLIAVDSTVAKDPTVDAVVSGLMTQIEATYGPVYTQQIGSATGFFKEVADSMTMNGYRDTPIGNLTTDAFRALTGTDIAIEPGGSTAQPIYAGPLVADDAFRVVGYGFNLYNGLGYHLIRVDMTGQALVQGLEFGLSQIESDDEFFLQSSGLAYAYNATLPPFSRFAGATVGGVAFDAGKTYSVTANYFVKLFLDNFGIPYSNLHEYGNDTTEFMALTRYLVQHSPVSPSSGSRILSPVKDTKGSSVPLKFRLDQNYPNPFNPSTTIGYQLPRAEYVRMVVYNVLGQEVSTVVDGKEEAGYHQVEWRPLLPSGVYFCTLGSGGLVQTRKLLLLR